MQPENTEDFFQINGDIQILNKSLNFSNNLKMIKEKSLLHTTDKMLNIPENHTAIQNINELIIPFDLSNINISQAKELTKSPKATKTQTETFPNKLEVNENNARTMVRCTELALKNIYQIMSNNYLKNHDYCSNDEAAYRIIQQNLMQINSIFDFNNDELINQLKNLQMEIKSLQETSDILKDEYNKIIMFSIVKQREIEYLKTEILHLENLKDQIFFPELCDDIICLSKLPIPREACLEKFFTMFLEIVTGKFSTPFNWKEFQKSYLTRTKYALLINKMDNIQIDLMTQREYELCRKIVSNNDLKKFIQQRQEKLIDDTTFYLKKIIKWCNYIADIYDLKAKLTESEKILKKSIDDASYNQNMYMKKFKALEINEEIYKTYMSPTDNFRLMKEKYTEINLEYDTYYTKSIKTMNKMKNITKKINSNYVHADPEIYDTSPVPFKNSKKRPEEIQKINQI